MQKYDINMAKHFQVRRRWNSIWKRITMALASVVVFCTVYALILPAITMEPEYICGQESHLHTEACYQLPELTTLSSLICTSDALGVHNHTPECYDENGEPKCGIADFVLHTHNSDCYDANDELVCPLPEIKLHTHDETCWQQPHVHDEPCFIQQHGELLCTLEEGSLHTHLDTCYIQQQNLICTLPETESHTHTTEACYTETKTLLCTESEVEAHTHSDSCYTIETIQICSQEETEGHTHGDGCFAEDGSTICVLPEIVSHTHTDACFQTTSNFTCTLTETAGHSHSDTCYSEPTSTLICTTEETDGHTHSDTCYETVSVVTCALEENIPHAHTDSCFVCTPVLQCAQPTGEDAVSVLNCEKKELILHTHESACFDQTGACVCGLLEVSEHIHDETCFAITMEQATEPVLACGYEEHEHTEACIAKEEISDSILTDSTFTEGTYCNAIEHTHQKGGEYPCFDDNDNLMCTITEHTHEELCYLDPEKRDEVDPDDNWQDALPEEDVLTGGIATDLITVAQLQLGYEESTDYYTVTEDEEILYFNRYAAWWASLHDTVPYGDWNAKLIAFCLSAADIPFPLAETPSDWLWDPELADYLLAEGELPFPADLVFLDNDRVGIVTAVDAEKGKLDVLLEWNGKVREKTFALDKDVLALARIPGNKPAVTIEPLPGEIVMPSIFTYEDEWLSMVLTVEGIASLPEGAVLPEGEALPEPTLAIRMLDDESNLYWQLFEAAQEHGEEGGLLGLTAMELQFWCGEYLLDTTTCTMTAEITLKETLLAPPVQTYSLRAAAPAPAPEAETGVEVAVIQADGNTVTSKETALFETTAEAPVMTFTVTNNVIAVATSEITNPSFTVQYYARIPRLQSTGSGESIEFMDTSGGALPKNNATSPTGREIRFDLKAVGTTSPEQNKDETATLYEFDMPAVATKLYEDAAEEYFSGMTVSDLNVLRDNDHYTLKRILTQEAGSTSWVEHDASAVLTNNMNAVESEDTAILITDGMLVYFEYEPTESTHSNSVNFFDYDISDTKVYELNWTRKWPYKISGKTAYNSVAEYYSKVTGKDYLTMKTYKQGINSDSNYSSTSDFHFAFGNNNTGSGRQTETWTDGTGYVNLPNRANNTGSNYTGCTFGLVSDYDINADKLQFSSGIAAPDIFNYNTGRPVIGKTTYSGNTLEFERIGDTYTLVSVNRGRGVSITAENLDQFFIAKHEEKTYTNNFWPMDNLIEDDTIGHDFKFGNEEWYSSNVYESKQYYLREEMATADDPKQVVGLPQSDNGFNHNSYFGLQYAVEFTLDGEYLGPLEYVFYGDDDMWVFLTNHKTGESQLICDIGGVHSSVGSYTDLWDYVKKGEAGAGTYTLTFFYTERGASGSSCFMQFTLPSVTSVIQNTPDTGSIQMGKEISNGTVLENPNQDYTFEVTIDSNDKFPYSVTSQQGGLIDGGTIQTGGSFSLKAGQFITITGIPTGTMYTIKETFDTDGSFGVAWNNNGAVTTGSTYSGRIAGGQTVFMTCTNTALTYLTLEKQVNSTAAEDFTKPFSFTLTLDDTTINGAYGDVTFVDGIASVTLCDNEQVTITGLPAGVTYSISETTADGYNVEYVITDTDTNKIISTQTGVSATGTLPMGNITVVCTNAPGYCLPETGGRGATKPLICGAGLMAISLWIGRQRRYRGRRLNGG